jgi:hypothetical protein
MRLLPLPVCANRNAQRLFLSLCFLGSLDLKNSILTSFRLGHPSVIPSDAATWLLGINVEATSRKTNSARWKPPSTSYWTHSVYHYNKSTIKALPITAGVTRKILRAYFNMLPCDSRDVLKRYRVPRGTGPSLFKAFVSDRGSKYPSLKQHLIGKISGHKNSFWRPFRRLIDVQPNIVFKHYPDGIDFTVFVYDRRIEVVRQHLLKLARRLNQKP